MTKPNRRYLFLNPLSMLLAGLILGVAARLFDIHFQNLGEIFSHAGIVAVSVMSSVLLFDRLRLYDFVIDGVLIYILFFQKIKRSQRRKERGE